jgi:hypothetical protein
VSCAETKFGQSLYDKDGATDDYGEQVSVVYDWDYSPSQEDDDGVYCGTCGGVIIEPVVPDCPTCGASEAAERDDDNEWVECADCTASAFRADLRRPTIDALDTVVSLAEENPYHDGDPDKRLALDRVREFIEKLADGDRDV